MYRHLFFCFVLLFGLTLRAQTADTINIRGKVTDAKNNNAALSGATVTLMGQNMTETTDDNGEFAITKNVVAVMRFKVPQAEKIAFKKGVLELYVPNSSPLKVEIFDVKGNLLKKEVSPNAAAGTYRMDVAEIATTSQLLIIKASIGERSTTYRYLPLHNGFYTLKTTAEHAAQPLGKLAQVAAAVDTLEVAKDEFDTKKIPIESFIIDNTIEISLDSTVTVDENALAVRLDQEKQTMQGFGINATIMPGGKSLPWDQLYKTEGNDALGLSILRIGMDENGRHRDVPNDWTSVRNVNPDVKIIGSCWSAPAGWKTNNNVNHGGHLKPEYYTQWAERIAKYAKDNNLYAMGVSNEADFESGDGAPRTGDYPSMVYTGKEMAAFVKEARKAFDQYAPGVKLISPEASLWIHVWSNLSPEAQYKSVDPLGCKCWSNDITEAALAQCAEKCNNGDGYDYGHWLAKDQESWDAVDILGVHEYESQKAYKWPADVTGGVRTKEIWQTEMSGVMYWPEQGPSTSIENGVAVARWIQSGLMVGEASAWCYWWYEAYYSNDNEGLAIIQGSSTKAKRYYTFGNYSRYIRPGDTIVNITGTDNTDLLPAKVLLTASKSDAGKVVIVAVNETTSDQSVPIKIAGGTVPASFKPIVTNGSANWKEGTAVSVSDGVLTMQLEKMSVTTFVSE